MIKVGEAIVSAARALVVEVIEAAPDGLTNAEIARASGLRVAFTPSDGRSRDTLTWMILADLVKSGRVTREGGNRPRYRVA